MIQARLSGALSSIPAQVQNAILADASCENLWFCRQGRHEAIPIEDIRLSSLLPPSPTLTTTTTAAAVLVKGESVVSGCDVPDWQLVYDVMRVHRDSVVFSRDHAERIRESCALALPRVFGNSSDNGATPSFPVADVMRVITEYIRNYKRVEADVNLKFITWMPTCSEKDCVTKLRQELLQNFAYVVYFVKSFFPPPVWYVEGTHLAVLYNAQRHTPNAKILQTSLRTRANDLQNLTDTYEALLVRDAAEDYLVPEGSRSNYLIVTKDNRLLCSLEKDILVGITLRAVRRAATATGLSPIEHRQLYVGDLCMAAAIAVLGTSPGVLPVREILFYYDAETQREFLAALDHYEKHVPADRCALLPRDLILHASGRLQLSSTQNATLTRLREAYEMEAFQ